MSLSALSADYILRLSPGAGTALWVPNWLGPDCQDLKHCPLPILLLHVHSSPLPLQGCVPAWKRSRESEFHCEPWRDRKAINFKNLNMT